MRNLFPILIFLICSHPVYAQIRGKVVDIETSIPLSGAHVIADMENTTTGNEGTFVLEKPTSRIVITYLGYLPDTLKISGETGELFIQLTPVAKLIDEIVIRGYFNEFPVMQMPSATGYIGNPEKQNLNPISFTEYLNSVPGIYAHSGTLNTNRITIRGIGSRTPYGTNRIKAYYNGIPLTSGDGTTEIEDVNASLIGSVAILKGSKSALYGSGLGGVIVLNKPDYIIGFHGYGKTTLGSYQTSQYEAGLQYMANGYYLAGQFAKTRSAGWRQNSEYRRQNFELNTGFIHAKSELDIMLLAIDTRAEIPSSLNKGDFENAPQNAAQNWLEVKGFEEYTKYISGLKFKHKFNDSFINATHMFFRIYEGYESRPFNILDDEAFSWGLRNITTINISKFKIQAGFEGLMEKYSWAIYETLAGEQGSLQNKFSERRSPLSVFLNGQYKFTKGAVIEAGLSLNTLKYNLEDQFDDAGDLSGDYRYEMVASPFIGFNVPVFSGLHIYGSVSHGFSAPSVEETLLPEGSINPDLKPETGVNAETGVRFESRDRQVFVDACFYRLWAQNLLITRRETEDIFYGANAGKTVHTGLEINSTFQLTDAAAKYPVSLNISYNFIKATFTDFTDDGMDYSGNTLPGIPQQNLWISANVESVFGIYLFPQYQFTGKQYLNDANEGSSPAFKLFNFKVGYAKDFGKINADIAFGVRNLLDEHYASMILVNAPSFGGSLPRYYYPGMPRNYFVSLKVGF